MLGLFQYYIITWRRGLKLRVKHCLRIGVLCFYRKGLKEGVVEKLFTKTQARLFYLQDGVVLKEDNILSSDIFHT